MVSLSSIRAPLSEFMQCRTGKISGRIKKVPKHEFRYHLEGRVDLEVEDRREIEAYLKNWNNQKPVKKLIKMN